MDSTVDFEITSREIPNHLSRLCETTEKAEVLLNPEKNLWVTEGVPVKDVNAPIKEIEIPSIPHVFMVHELWVSDKDHQNMLLQDVPVIFAHGHREGDVWKFANGQSVGEVVAAYNERGAKNGTPQIEMVLSCNKDNSPDPMGIKVKDLPDHIAQAVGEPVSLYMGHGQTQMEEGKVTMTVSVEGKFWGLDQLQVYKNINISHSES